MAATDLRAIVRRSYGEVFTGRNLAAPDEVMAPDFVGHAARADDSTLADMRRDITREHACMPEEETIVEEQLLAGDRVITRWRDHWKHARALR